VRALGLALTILLASACTSFGTEPDEPLVGCPQALAEGTLEVTAPDRLLLHTDADELVEIRWTSLTVRQGPQAELVDSSGRVVAQAGDRVSITGGYLEGRTFTECDGVRLVRPAA
jgi:hypothetical protein